MHLCVAFQEAMEIYSTFQWSAGIQVKMSPAKSTRNWLPGESTEHEVMDLDSKAKCEFGQLTNGLIRTMNTLCSEAKLIGRN